MSLEEELIKLNDIIEDIISKSQKKTVVNYAKTLENLRTEVRRLYDKYADSESKLSFSQIKGERLYELENKITANLTKLYTDSNGLIKTTLNNVFVTTVDKTINAVDRAEPKKIKSLIAIKKELDIDKTVNEKMAGLHWASRMGHHRSNVIYNVNATIKANLSKGSTYKEMSDTLSKALNGDVLQPMRIIRTESARVYSSAKMQSLDKCRQSGVDMVKIWHSSKDERVRSQHREMDGAVVDYDDVFTFPDGITTKAPCQSGAAHHDIHCRCFITVDLKEFYQDKDLQSSKTDDDENTNRDETKDKATEKGLKYTKQQEDKAAQWYVSGDGQWVNHYLRGNSEIVVDENEKELIDALKQATNNEIVKESMLYRSVDARAVFGDMTDTEYEQLKSYVVYKADDKYSLAAKEKFLKDIKGKRIIEKGFMSTSKDLDVALNWGNFTGSEKPIVLELEVPKGIKGKDLKAFDIFDDKQYEVLLHPNQRYIINEITSKQGSIYVKASLESDKSIVDEVLKKGYNNKNSKIVFKKAKTIKEANEFAEKLGFKADYKGIDIKCANEWNLGLYNAKKDFPEIAENIKFVGTSQKRYELMKKDFEDYFYKSYCDKHYKKLKDKGYSDDKIQKYFKKKSKEKAADFTKGFKSDVTDTAQSFGKRANQILNQSEESKIYSKYYGITINEEYFKDNDFVIAEGKREVANKWRPVGCYTTKSVFDHEFAHQIDGYLNLRDDFTIKKIFENASRTSLKNELCEYAYGSYVNDNTFVKHEDAKEMIAEAWSEYNNNSSPREIAKIIGEKIEKLWKNRK